METTRMTGPYRATRLWNEAMRIFHSGMPRKKHWKHLKLYEDCFTAENAVTWLHSQLILNTYFGPNIKKDQVQQLLCKFLKAGALEDVRGSEFTNTESFRENSGLYRLTNRSPFRNPRTPGKDRLPLSTIANNNKGNQEFGSPKLANPKATLRHQQPTSSQRSPNISRNTLLDCHLTAKQLSLKEVEDIWKNATLRNIEKLLGISNISSVLDISQTTGKWILWNVNKVGIRGVVEPMEDITESPPSWVLYGMKSLVNWPSNNNQKIPDYEKSEIDVFKVITDYFTKSSSPLATFFLYTLLQETFIRAEAADLEFRKSTNQILQSNTETACSTQPSALVGISQRTVSTPLIHSFTQNGKQFLSEVSSSLPIVKSPLSSNRQQFSRMPPSRSGTPSRLRFFNERREHPCLMTPRSRKAVPTSCSYNVPLSACFETAFTGVEPHTRIVSQNRLTFSHRSNFSSQSLKEKTTSEMKESSSIHNLSTQEKPYFHRSLENIHSLDHLRSKSGGYVNVAAFGSTDCLDTSEYLKENGKTHPGNTRSIASLSSNQSEWITGLSPSISELSLMTTTSSQPNYDNENTRYMSHIFESASEESPLGYEGQLRNYRNSPNKKRLIGRRKGLEHYYGSEACRPGLMTERGKDMAIESLQLITLLLHPDLRRKLHLLLRFMAKVSANPKLCLDDNVSTKMLMVNTFYRCIVCASDEAEYDELLAVRLVTFLTENVEKVMLVPHKLCSGVRETLLDIQREKIRFQPMEDSFPLAFCIQVSTDCFERQRSESSNAIRQLLDHIINDPIMSVKEKRKRLKQFQEQYPSIYRSKFPHQEANNDRPDEMRSSIKQSAAMFARIRNLRIA